MNAPKLLILSICACVGTQMSAQQQSSPSESLDSEATAQVKRHFESFWVERGDSWFGIMYELIGGANLVQAKGVRFDVRSHGPATEADKLNGVDWEGTASVSARVARQKSLRNSPPLWGNWENYGASDFLYKCSLGKRNGKWTIEVQGIQLTRPDAAKLDNETAAVAPHQDSTNQSADSSDSNKRIIGTWRKGQEVVTYSNDGTGVLLIESQGKAVFTWTIEGEALTLTFTAFNDVPYPRKVVNRGRLKDLSDNEYKWVNFGDGQVLLWTRIK